MGMIKQVVQDPQALLKCPRCDSPNTKFCYYNNYSLSQPRHFCKACKRYWTRGGTLRSVPVGGGCRKNKRMKRSAAAPPSTHQTPLQSDVNFSFQNYNSRVLNEIASCIGYDNGVSVFGGGFSSMGMDNTSQQIHDEGFVNFQGFGSSSLEEVKPSNDYQEVIKREEGSELLSNNLSNNWSNNVESSATCIDSLDSLAYWNTVGGWADLSNYESSVLE